MSLFGFTLNNLSLFGLVLAIGIVVDDAIVVVENVERNIAAGLRAARGGASRAWTRSARALIAIALVLCAVFVPSAFITGISGQFYRQFALTIAGATVISLIVSLTLSPALCALLLKPHDPAHRDRWYEKPLRGFFRVFNRGFDCGARRLRLARRPRRAPRRAHAAALCRRSSPSASTNSARRRRASSRSRTAAILILAAQLPPGASLARTDEVMKRAWDIARSSPRRRARHPHRRLLRRHLHQRAQRRRDLPGARRLQEARGRSAPVGGGDPGRAVRQAGGDRGRLHRGGAAALGAGHRQRRRLPHDGRGPRRRRAGRRLQGAVYAMMGAAAQTPGLQQVFSLFETATPQLYLDIDRTKAQLLGINMPDVFNTLQVYLGVDLRQRLQSVRPHLPGAGAGRRALPARSAGRAEPARAQFLGRDRAARLVHDRARHLRPLPHAALQSLSGGRARRLAGARLQPGPGHRADAEAGGAGAAGRLLLRMDHARLTSSSAPAIPRSSPSRSAWCSCSWCWRRNSKA